MTMTHKQALRVAVCAISVSSDRLSATEIVLRSYIDARGLVMVPREPTAGQMAAGVIQDATIDKYSAMLAAAPDPFAD